MSRTKPWFKLYDELIDDLKLRTFSPAQKWAWVSILCLANKSEEERGTVRGDDEDLAAICGFSSASDWQAFKNRLIQKGMIEPISPYAFVIANWEKRQTERKPPSASPERVTARTRKCKENKKSLTGTTRNEGGTITDQDQDLDLDPEEEKIPPTPQNFEAEAEDAPEGAGEFGEQARKTENPHLQKLELPKELDFPKFRESLGDWMGHCQEHGLQIRPTQFRKLIEKFKTWGVEKSIKQIDHSIASGYKGVVEPFTGIQGGKGEFPPPPMFPPVPKDQFVKPDKQAVNSALRLGLQQAAAGHLADQVRLKS